MTAPTTAPDYDWEAAGRDLGAKLDRLHAVAVLGIDQITTVEVALGIARQQARRRKILIGDLFGEPGLLHALAPSEADYGLSDVFEHGVSVDKIARPFEGEPQLRFVPAGTFVGDQAESFTHRGWTRLAAAARKNQRMLLIVASISAEEIESLVVQLEGAVLVGDRVRTRLPAARVLGVIRGPQRASRAIRAQVAPPRERYVIQAPRTLKRALRSAGLALAAIVCALGIWTASHPLGTTSWTPAWLRRGSPRVAGPAFIRVDSLNPIPDSALKLTPNFGLVTKVDSASLSPFGIALVTFNTQAGALLELQRHGASLRAGTFTPVLIRDTPWYRVVAGAYPDSASAAALLDTLRARGTSDAGRAVIERFPYALLVERDVPDVAVAARIARFQARGLPVYALLQRDGTARVYAGAFKVPEEAESLYEAMRTARIFTSLVYRTGRVY